MQKKPVRKNQPEKPPFPIPFREWARIFRWAYPAATLVALIWVFRLQLDCTPGATIGVTHPVQRATAQLTPHNGAPGLESWVLPLHKLRDADTLISYAENALREQRRVALGTPELELNARMRYAFSTFEPNPPFRLLLGDDPPGQRLRDYAGWIDNIAELDDAATRDRVRGFMRFAERFSQTLTQPDNDRISTSYAPLFSTAVWREQNHQVIIRLGKSAGWDSVSNSFKPAYGKVIGSAAEARDLKSRLLWLIPAMLLALLFAFWREKKTDPAGWKCSLAGIIGTGVWTLVAWEWFLSPLDSIIWLLLPLPFYCGIALARYFRRLGSSPFPETTLRFFYTAYAYLSLIAFATLIIAGIVLPGLTGRLLLAVAGLLFGMIVSHGWCITEDTLTTPHEYDGSKLVKRRYWAVILFLPVFLWFVNTPFPNPGKSPFQPVLTQSLTDTTIVTDPYWIGPLSEEGARNVIATIRKQVPDAEIYHPVMCSVRELTKEDRDWLRPAPQLTLLGFREYEEDDLEAKRMDILGGWRVAVDRVDNLVKTHPKDTMLRQSWEAELHSGVVQKVTQELSSPHFDWVPELPRVTINPTGKNQEELRQNWRLFAFDQLERAGSLLRSTAMVVMHRNPLTVGGDWFDAFRVGNTQTILVVYTRNTDAMRLLALSLPPAVKIAGPAIVRETEQKSMWFASIAALAVLLGVVILTIRKQWWNSLCSLLGVAVGLGIAHFCGLPAAAIIIGGLVGLGLLLAMRDNWSAVGLGIVLVLVPVAAVAVIAIVVLIGGFIRMAGNTD